MKLTGFLLCVLCLHVAGRTVSQTVTLSAKDMHLRKVFDIVEKQTGYVVFSNRDLLANTRPVTLSVQNMPLQSFLQELLVNQPVLFRIDNNTIILSRKLTLRSNPGQEPGLDTVPHLQLIYGRVTDEKGTPLDKASILLKGTNRGWATSADGKFTVLAESGILVFSSVGFKPKEVPVKAGSYIIQLEPVDSRMEDVVVTGIFNRRAESFTGSAQTYTREQLMKVGTINVLQSLKNLDPSFNLLQNLEIGSDPNALPSIQLRGQSGFPDLRGEYQTDPNQPLFILDGFEVSLTRIIDLDMTRVVSITLLKDAAAKAIYGSKAANGVVVIETQRPKAGKMQVTYTGNIQVGMPDLSSYNLANAAEKLDVEKSAGLYNAPGNADQQYLNNLEYNRLLEEVLSGVNTDWLSQPVDTRVGQKHSLYVEGGTDAMRYAVDFSHNNFKGVMKGSERNTTAGVITLWYRYGKLLLRNNLDVSYNKGVNSPYGDFSQYARMNPYYRATDEQGNITRVAGENTVNGGAAGNPLWNTTINTRNFSEYTQLVNNFYAEYALSQALRFTGRVSITRKESGDEQFYPASHTMFLSYTTEDLVKRKGLYVHGDGFDKRLAVDLTANYAKTIGEHFLSANLAASMSDIATRNTSVSAEGFPNDFLDDITFARQYLQNSRPAGMESTIRDLGLMSAVNYSFADRFLVDASYRLSASSQFGSDNRWGSFWSAGLGWNLHKEAFARNWKKLDQLRIRGSLGYSGSQNFNSYQSKSTFSYNPTDTYLGNYGAYLLGLSNEKLQWQRKYDQNIGVDLALFNRALTIRADYYTANTNDLLTDVTVPSSTGFTTYKENLGKVKNIGMELALGYRFWSDRRRGNFASVFVAATHNKNTIQQISNSLATYNKEQAEIISNRPVVRYAEGQSMSAIWAVPSYGIDPATGREIYVKADGSITHAWDANDLAVVGDAAPKVRGNLGFNVEFNGWSLNVSSNWEFGGQIYNQTLVGKVENADMFYNVDRRVFSERWRQPGDISRFKNIANRGITRSTERFVEDQDLWSLSAVNLMYDLARLRVFKNANLSRLRIGVNMVDVTQLSSVRIERGTGYPFARNFNFSVQAMF